MLFIALIIFIGGLLLNWLSPHPDIKLFGQALIVFGCVLVALLDFLGGHIFLGLVMAFCAAINWATLQQDEIKFGLSWWYATKMTFRRIIGDL